VINRSFFTKLPARFVFHPLFDFLLRACEYSLKSSQANTWDTVISAECHTPVQLYYLFVRKPRRVIRGHKPNVNRDNFSRVASPRC
jgi:hypothetical protein